MPNNSDNFLMKFMDLMESNINEHQKEMKAIDFKDFIKSGCKKNNRLNEKDKRDILQKVGKMFKDFNIKNNDWFTVFIYYALSVDAFKKIEDHVNHFKTPTMLISGLIGKGFQNPLKDLGIPYLVLLHFMGFF